MKKILFLLIFLAFGCKNQMKQTDETKNIDSASQKDNTNQVDITKYYTTKDTVIITTELDDTLKFSKEEFNEIIDNHEELYNNDNIENPDQLYDYNGKVDELFDCEVCKDNYYILYAYFLKQKNGDKKYAERRKRIIDIYSNINLLFDHFQYGGTYFGHQKSRIIGYAEYSIYTYSESENDLTKTYNISKQKEYYIKSLRQLIKDESSIDCDTIGKEKIIRNKELNKIVDEIDKLITDLYYLRTAQEFQYEHYDYY